MTLSVSERTKNYRQRKSLAGFRRLEIILPGGVVAMMDAMCEAENMSRASYLAAVLEQDYEKQEVQYETQSKAA